MLGWRCRIIKYADRAVRKYHGGRLWVKDGESQPETGMISSGFKSSVSGQCHDALESTTDELVIESRLDDVEGSIMYIKSPTQ